MYVALEGIDTCGKSTQMALLKDFFANKAQEVIFTCEPGGSELGIELRKILLEKHFKLSKEAEVLLFLADRAQHTNEILIPNRHKWIFADRSLISGIAYAKDFSYEQLKILNLFATQGVLPQKVIILEMTQDLLKERLAQKGQDKIEQRGIAYLLALQERIIETTQKLGVEYLRLSAKLPKEEITQKILDFVCVA